MCMAALGLALLVSYCSFGHGFVRALYASHLSVANQLMEDKAETPLPLYFAAADNAVLNASLILALAAIGLLLIRDLLGLALAGISILAGSLSVFVLLEVFPPLVTALHFDTIPYFKDRLNCIPDPEIGCLPKPLTRSETANFRGWAYSPSYGIDEPANTVDWETDENGFRNQPGVPFADVVVLGSSFPGYGNNLEDTYPRKLERLLNGYTVANLGLGGTDPFTFMNVFRRFGLPKKPRYAILMFHTGDVDAYLKPYVTGEENPRLTNHKVVFGSFWPRWRLALQQTWRMLRSGPWQALQLGFQRIVGTEAINLDLVVLRLPGNITEHALLSRHTGRPTGDSLNSATWRLFEKILRDFKEVSEQHQIVPLLAYIPLSSEVYAEYSTRESGRDWLVIRESQMATSANDEEAARRLAEKAGIELISFFPAFKDAARHGKFVYLRFDDHWNSEGSEIAARVTAEALQAQIRASTSAPQQRAH